MSHAKGVVTKIRSVGPINIVFIQWTGNVDLPEKAVEANLAKVGPNVDYCNCE